MRTFVAIEITNQQVIDSIKKFQSELNINAKPVESKNFHFTLEFLGEISDEMVQKVISALNTIEFSRFDVILKGVGAFPKPKFPRVVWVGTEETGGRLMVDLAKKVENVLKPLSFSSDKPFKPHLTVFRIKKKIGDITEELDEKRTMEFGKLSVTGIKLKKSELTPNGPDYSDLLEVKAI